MVGSLIPRTLSGSLRNNSYRLASLVVDSSVATVQAVIRRVSGRSSLGLEAPLLHIPIPTEETRNPGALDSFTNGATSAPPAAPSSTLAAADLEHRVDLAASFVQDAEHGRNPSRRTTRGALTVYRWYHSRVGQCLRYASTVCFILVPVFEEPGWCRRADCGSPKYWWGTDFIRPVISGSVELVSLTVISLDLTARLHFMGWREFKRDRWLSSRAVVVLLTGLDVCVDVLLRPWARTWLTRMLRIYVFLTQHHNLRVACVNIFRTVPALTEVLLMLLVLILLASWAAMLLFGQVSGSGFDTYANALVSISVLSTVTNFPEVMLGAFRKYRVSFLFFVAFLCVGVLVLMNLALAIVYEAYRINMANEVTRLLHRQRRALRFAFDCLAVPLDMDHGQGGVGHGHGRGPNGGAHHAGGAAEPHAGPQGDSLRDWRLPALARHPTDDAQGTDVHGVVHRRTGSVGSALCALAESFSAYPSSMADRSSSLVGGEAWSASPLRQQAIGGQAPSISRESSGMSVGGASVGTPVARRPLARADSVGGSLCGLESSVPASAPTSRRVSPRAHQRPLSTLNAHRQADPVVRGIFLRDWLACLRRLAPELRPWQAELLFHGCDVKSSGYLDEVEFSNVVAARQLRFEPVRRPRTSRPTWRERILLTVRDRRLERWFDFLALVTAVAIAWPAREVGLVVHVALVAVFVLEMLVKLCALGPAAYFRYPRSQFDCLVCLIAVGALTYNLSDLGKSEKVVHWTLELWIFRALRLLGLSRRFALLGHTLRKLRTPFLTFLGVLFCFLYASAGIGVELFGGVLYEGAPCLADSEYARKAYHPINFNSLLSAFALAFSLLMVNDFPVFMDALTVCSSGWARVYFVLFHLCNVVIVSNLLTSFILEATLRAWADVDAESASRDGGIGARRGSSKRGGWVGTPQLPPQPHRCPQHAALHSVPPFVIPREPPAGEKARPGCDSARVLEQRAAYVHRMQMRIDHDRIALEDGSSFTIKRVDSVTGLEAMEDLLDAPPPFATSAQSTSAGAGDDSPP